MLFKRTKATTLTPTQELLVDLFVLGACAVVAAAPWAAVAALPFVRDMKKQPSKRRLQNSYEYARRHAYINTARKNGRVRLSLTKSGEKRAAKLYFGRRVYPVPRRWDKKWRVLLYDVPETEKYKREMLRRFIRAHGFVRLQRSVWVYPYDCREQVDRLTSFLRLSENKCRLLEVARLGNDAYLRRLFGLT